MYFIKSYLLIILILLTLLSTLSSCLKDPVETGPYYTVIEGTATEKGTGFPVVGQKISLYGPITGYDVPDELITDENGYFRFDIGEVKDSRQFSIDFFGSNKYFHWPGEHYAQNQGHNVINPKLYAAGWVALHLKNVNSWNGDDNIFFMNGESYSLSGIVDRTILLRMPANEDREFRYTVTRRGKHTVFTDTIHPIGHDTITHEIFY